MLVIRTNKSNELLNSEPCSVCTELIKASGIISTVVYSDENGNLVKTKSSNLAGLHITGGMRSTPVMFIRNEIKKIKRNFK